MRRFPRGLVRASSEIPASIYVSTKQGPRMGPAESVVVTIRDLGGKSGFEQQSLKISNLHLFLVPRVMSCQCCQTGIVSFDIGPRSPEEIFSHVGSTLGNRGLPVRYHGSRCHLLQPLQIYRGRFSGFGSAGFPALRAVACTRWSSRCVLWFSRSACIRGPFPPSGACQLTLLPTAIS